MNSVFFTGYHVAVNSCLLEDLNELGITVYMPDSNWGRISFFADNHQYNYPNIRYITYNEFLKLQRIAIIIPCTQLLNDMLKLEEDRGNIDAVIHLTAQDNYGQYIKDAQYLLSHDLIYHRESKAIKMLYFNRPAGVPEIEKNYTNAFNNRDINSYISDLHSYGPYKVGADLADEFARKWPNTKFYGHLERDGMLDRKVLLTLVSQSMFTLCFKSSETWGQGVNESMLLGTPTIQYKPFLTSMFSNYLITDDTAIIVNSVDEAIDRITKMSFDEYETMCVQAKTMSELLTSSEPRRKQLSWFLNKII
jgi:hypothetical protein